MILCQRKRFTVVYEDSDDGISVRTLIKAIIQTSKSTKGIKTTAMPLLFKNFESGIPRDPRTRICRSFRWTRAEEDALILVMRSVRESAYLSGWSSYY
ncbi:hypothetical protein ARMGADRAFT_1018961 [Armillaria gallica]|uniref:Uncharacterized protein n=1 Tax=Armillaria gallica TaxID=47427 RepID=A0A2H3CL19_ARMGA|nr:hypothetical protein ARMGADRAFT_1018961 [Armillaria gallica]